MISKFVAMLLVVVYSIATVSLIELFKIPRLLDHCIEHNDSITEFFTEHYSADEDQKCAHHEQLPFSCSQQSVVLLCADVPQSQMLQLWTPQRYFFTPSAYVISSFSTKYLSQIFQPPRFC